MIYQQDPVGLLVFDERGHQRHRHDRDADGRSAAEH